MTFRQRVWDDAGARRSEQQNKTRYKYQLDHVQDLQGQLNGQIQIMQNAQSQAAANSNLAVADYISAYKFRVDNQSKAWKAWTKLLTQDAPKEYRKYVDQQIKIGHVKYKGRKPSARPVSEIGQDEGPIVETTALDVSNTEDESTKAPKQESLTKTDTAQLAGSLIHTSASDQLAEDNSLTSYDKLKALANLSNHHQERGFLQAATLDKANNIEIHIQNYMQSSAANQELFIEDESGNVVKFIPSELTLDDPPELHRAAREWAQNQIMGDLAEVSVNGISLNPQFIADKVIPILDTSDKAAYKKYQDAYITHRLEVELNLAEQEYYNYLDGGAGKENITFASVIKKVTNAYRMADRGKGTANTLTKEFLSKLRDGGMERVYKNKGDVDKYKAEWQNQMGVFPWTGKKPVKFSEAFPKIFSDQAMNALDINTEKKWIGEQLQGKENDAKNYVLQYEEAVKNGEFGKAASLKTAFDQAGYNIWFPSLDNAMDKSIAQLKKSEAGVAFLKEQYEANGELTQKDLENTDNSTAKIAMQKLGLKDSDIQQYATNADPRFKAEQTAAEKLLTDKVQQMSVEKGSVIVKKGGYFRANDFFLKAHYKEMVRIKGTEEGRLMSQPQLANAATESVLSKIRDDTANYEADRLKGLPGTLTPYVLTEQGWEWHMQDRGAVNKTQRKLSLATAVSLQEQGFDDAVLNMVNLPETLYKSDTDGSLNDFWSQAAKASGHRYTPLEIARANALRSGIPLEIEGDEESADATLTALKEGGLNYVPSPDTKDFERKIEAINAGRGIWRWDDPFRYLFKSGRENALSVVRQDRKEQAARELVQLKYMSQKRVFEITDKELTSGEHNTKEAAVNAASYNVLAERYGIVPQEEFGGTGVGLVGEYDSTGNTAITFPNNQQAVNYVTLRNYFFTRTGESLRRGLTVNNGVITVTNPKVVTDLNRLDPQGHLYGWELVPVEATNSDGYTSVTGYTLNYVGPRVSPQQKIKTGER